MNLVDIPIIGISFTWKRGKSCSRLDRILVDLVWNDKFPNLKL